MTCFLNSFKEIIFTNTSVYRRINLHIIFLPSQQPIHKSERMYGSPVATSRALAWKNSWLRMIMSSFRTKRPPWKKKLSDSVESRISWVNWL